MSAVVDVAMGPDPARLFKTKNNADRAHRDPEKPKFLLTRKFLRNWDRDGVFLEENFRVFGVAVSVVGDAEEEEEEEEAFSYSTIL